MMFEKFVVKVKYETKMLLADHNVIWLHHMKLACVSFRVN